MFKICLGVRSANFSFIFLIIIILFVCLFDFILYVPSRIIQLNRDGSSWVEPVLS